MFRLLEARVMLKIVMVIRVLITVHQGTVLLERLSPVSPTTLEQVSSIQVTVTTTTHHHNQDQQLSEQQQQDQLRHRKEQEQKVKKERLFCFGLYVYGVERNLSFSFF